LSASVGIAAGVAGAGLVQLALAPLYAANNYIGSYFFGSGMILGERDMYQEDWPKIKLRLDKGESFISIIEEQTINNTTAIMGNAKNIVMVVKEEWNRIVFDYLRTLPEGAKLLLGLLNVESGQTVEEYIEHFLHGHIHFGTTTKETEPVPEPIPTPDCPTGFRWSISAQQCVPEDIEEPSAPIDDPLIKDEPTPEIGTWPFPYNSSKDVAPQAIGVVLPTSDGQILFATRHVEGGKFVDVGFFPTFGAAMIVAVQAYPPEFFTQVTVPKTSPTGAPTQWIYFVKNAI